MKPYDYIAEVQYAWARRHGICIDEAGYVAQLNDNLFLPLIPEAIREYQAGAGAELDNNMRAVHSSSALVAIVFNYWRLYQNIEPIIAAISPTLANYKIQGIRFEAQCSDQLAGTAVRSTHSSSSRRDHHLQGSGPARSHQGDRDRIQVPESFTARIRGLSRIATWPPKTRRCGKGLTVSVRLPSRSTRARSCSGD